MTQAKNIICLWYDKDAEEAAKFIRRRFPDSEVAAVHKAPGDFPDGKAGQVLTVEFTVFGIPCLGLNGGDYFKRSEAFSFQIATEDQEETDRYWNAMPLLAKGTTDFLPSTKPEHERKRSIRMPAGLKSPAHATRMLHLP